jgi:TRAP-type C4-dicarboxylate transport system substrate-binding protein
MIKRISCLIYLLAVCIVPAHGKTFKIATISPDGTRWMEELKSGAAEVAKRTNNRVKFRFYPGGVMGNDKSVMRKIKIGQLQGGAITGGGLLDIDPDSQVYSLPLAFRSHDEVDYVRKRMDPLIIDGLYKNGFVSFGLGEGGFAYLMSDQPLDDVSNLKKQKVWVPDDDAISRAAFEAIGVSPIPLPLTDVLTGLQTGMIDTVAASPMGAIALQWHTRVKYMNLTPLIYLFGTLIIDRKQFEKLSPADQQVVREVMSGVFSRLDQINREDNEKAYEALKQQGIIFVKSNEASEQQWRSSIEKATQQLIQDGVVGKEITRLMYKYLDEYRNGAGAN